jgi:hypothetical protein
MKKSILGILLAALSLNGFAQSSSEIGISTGFSSYLGDLQPQDYTYRDVSLAGGIFARHNVSPEISFRSFLNYARVQASDANSGVQSHIDRNLHFRSDIVEAGIVTEVNILPFDSYHAGNRRSRRYFNLVPYVFGGVNLFHFNPKAEYKGSWVALQPLHTEGQDMSYNGQAPYSLTQIAIPFGMGFKYQTAGHICISFEMGFRKTFTDYLDDVSGNYPDLTQLEIENGSIASDMSYRGDELSTGFKGDMSYQQRGNSSNKDWYMINTLSVSYKFYHARRRSY